LAFCSSLAYLAQDFMLHGKRLTSLSRRLPPLDTLDFLTNRLVALGFALLSIGILFGSIWAQRQWGAWWSWDPKLVLAMLTWCIYATYIYLRTLSGWKGKRSMMLIVIGFFLILVTFLGTNFLPGRHRFVGASRPCHSPCGGPHTDVSEAVLRHIRYGVPFWGMTHTQHFRAIASA
jgi:ABC-type transport system involved in cytochrome c biogenesis permease subunit